MKDYPTYYYSSNSYAVSNTEFSSRDIRELVDSLNRDPNVKSYSFGVANERIPVNNVNASFRFPYFSVSGSIGHIERSSFRIDVTKY